MCMYPRQYRGYLYNVQKCNAGGTEGIEPSQRQGLTSQPSFSTCNQRYIWTHSPTIHESVNVQLIYHQRNRR